MPPLVAGGLLDLEDRLVAYGLGLRDLEYRLGMVPLRSNLRTGGGGSATVLFIFSRSHTARKRRSASSFGTNGRDVELRGDAAC
jgi:hypothetical protein